MNVRPRRRILFAYVALYLAFVSVAARAIFELQHYADFWFMVGMLTVYLLLFVAEPFLINRKLAILHVFNILQAGLVLALIAIIGDLDFFALLFILPCGMSILYFPRRVAFLWIVSISILMIISLLVYFPINESVGYVIIYPTAIFLFTGLFHLSRQAEEAQNRSEMLLSDLQKANLKLQAYAAQAQELAAVNERNRLARELHDSVTQIIFGLTLSAQAARILMDQNPARAVTELDHLQVLAQNALAEMRSLIQQLHLHPNTEDGLAPAIRRLVAQHKSNDNLTVDLVVKEEHRLPDKMEDELYRVIQEALNNIVKHAQADYAVVMLDLSSETNVLLSIEDTGVGFEPARVRSLPGHLGLTSMNERVQSLHGQLLIDSKPGRGTRLEVEIPLEQEVEHAV